MTMLSRPIIVTMLDENQTEGAFKRLGKERTILAMSELERRQTGGAETIHDTMLLLADDEGKLVWVPRQSVRFVRIV